jgi:hypothetical protein
MIGRVWNRRAWNVPLLGVCIGLVAAAVVLAMTGGKDAVATNGPMISECDGRIRSIAIQYVHRADFAVPIYRQILSVLPGDVVVYAVCPDADAFQELKSEVVVEPGRLRPIITGHAMTAWSRDRWVALEPGLRETAQTLVAPAEENGAEIWPERLGDQQIAGDIARAVGLRATRSGLFFDGGDLLADSRTLFVAPTAIYRNVQHTCADEKELAEILKRQFGRTAVLLEKAPDHHVGMYMMAAGKNRVVVGDPHLGEPLVAKIDLPGGADFSVETQAKFDFVARVAAEAGYSVTRIPCVPARDGKTYLTFVNGIIDERDGRRTIYMPIFQGQERLNQAAAAVWRGLGYQVERIDVTSSFRFFGTLHCLVNVISKG